MTDKDPMPFGKHKGTPLEDVPASYFHWLHMERCDHPGIKKYIQDNLASLKAENEDLIWDD